MKKRKYKEPHQYSLRLDNPNYPVPHVDKNLPHILFHDGVWKLFRSRWKSRYRFKEPWLAACITGVTIPQLKANLARDHDRSSFGFYIRGDNRV